MPIEFRCHQCNQLLRVPDDSAGKNARCPKCQALMTVPQGAPLPFAAGSTSAPEPSPPPLPGPQSAATEPAPSAAHPFADQLQSPFGTGASATSTPFQSSGNVNPYAPPSLAAGQGYAPQYVVGPRPGLPWETGPRTFGSWFRTMGMVISSPSNAFSIMWQYGGLGGPLMFNIYGTGMLLVLVAMIGIPIAILVAVFGEFEGEAIAGMAVIAALILLFAMFYAFMISVVSPFIMAAIYHLCLMMFGGARQGFETTFRVICYGYFSLLLPGMFIGLVPYLGGLAFLIWTIAVFIIGFSRAHETTSGKAAAAVFTPMVVCCGFYIVLFAIMFATNQLN